MQILTPRHVRERVGFLVPRWTVGPIPDHQGIPFRSLAVASALYESGFEIVWFDQEGDLDWIDRSHELVTALEGCRLAFIWMNELDPMVQTANALRLANLLKDALPRIHVVAGGPFLTILPAEACFVDGPIDAFLRGYGEDVAPCVPEWLDGHLPPASIPGLVWRGERTFRANDLARHTRMRPEHVSLYRVLDLAPYVQRGGIFGNDQGTFTIGTARGCAKGCSFCFWNRHPPSLLDPATIVDLVVDLAARYGVKQYHLAELDFFSSRARPLRVARLWRERVPECTWFALVSPIDVLRYAPKELDLLVDGGCRKLELGTESGSPAVLRRLGKRHTPEDAVRITRMLLDRGVRSMHNFIFGFPGETAADRRASLNLILRLHDLDPERVFFTFRIFQPAWDTPLGEEAIAQTTDYPRRLDAVLEHRHDFGDANVHAMRWLSPSVEREIKGLVDYDLPMLVSRLAIESQPRRWLYHRLRHAARRRLRRAACVPSRSPGDDGCSTGADARNGNPRHEHDRDGLRGRALRRAADRWLFDHCLGDGLDRTYTP